ncbi:YaaC family protein [Jannaschia sp. W003]|uniref:YaaC family protein n=1 Tax=Jannaschia sp. W003 TaxID=2867012 RepID=UPI0021A28EA7|nr:YaaC family protein [Jannaschia sp. W003]UWQ22751.1 YaaC family protein [Jannaschia sp. W003]
MRAADGAGRGGDAGDKRDEQGGVAGVSGVVGVIVKRASSIAPDNFDAFCIRGLKQFLNLEYASKRLIDRQNVPVRHHRNARKQAKQIGFCLALGLEYMENSKVATLATKPVLLYYSAMNFALAELLMKQSGDSSLTLARAEHSHHGLSFGAPSNVSRDATTLQQMSACKAKPMVSSGKRRGTFELWHRTAREHPVIGVHSDQDGKTSGPIPLMIGGDERFELLDEGGVSLLECIKLIPSLSEELARYGAYSSYARGIISSTKSGECHSISVLVHPGPEEIISGVSENILVSPALVPGIEIEEFQSGFALTANIYRGQKVNLSLPMVTSLTSGEVRICGVKTSINEFGAFLAALFILSNLCRYYADFWMERISAHAGIAMIAESLCSEYFKRVPALVLAELEGTLFVRR